MDKLSKASSSPMDHIDITIIGSGVIGLAIAQELANTDKNIIILEKNQSFGEETSSRNSEVIHAGIYYPQNSQKALHCVHGKQLLYNYCQKHAIEHQKIGKLIIATNLEELSTLDEIKKKASANGVTDLKKLSREEVYALEPQVQAVGALFSPSTGIINSHQLMQSFLVSAEHKGAQLVCNTEVTGVTPCSNGIEVISRDANHQTYSFTTGLLINAAGLNAQKLAGSIESLEKETIPPLYLCKGNYFTLQGKSPFNHLIYPIPEKSGAGLGIHATIDLSGQVKFGPDTKYIDCVNYQVDEKLRGKFNKAILKYYPQVTPEKLIPAYSGIRPKLQGPGESFKDFIIQGVNDHGIKGLIQLFGIESPGLTSCLSIAEQVKKMALDGSNNL